MEIHLRQHEDGSFVFELKTKDLKKEVDVTNIVRDIVVEKIRKLQEKLDVEEKYRNWILESAQEQTKSLSTVASRYDSVLLRLMETNEAIARLADVCRKGLKMEGPLSELEKIRKQNEHFLENDSTPRKSQKS